MPPLPTADEASRGYVRPPRSADQIRAIAESIIGVVALLGALLLVAWITYLITQHKLTTDQACLPLSCLALIFGFATGYRVRSST